MPNISKRNTVQKTTVMKIVTSMHNHPTAEEVFAKARTILPSISLATVYRILREGAAEGRILEVPNPSGAERFDFNTASHAHFICEKCGMVYDVMVDVIAMKKQVPGDVKSAALTFRGVCNNCKKA